LLSAIQDSIESVTDVIDRNSTVAPQMFAAAPGTRLVISGGARHVGGKQLMRPAVWS
jgi:hypothetical protein